jgi:hypothetical protein
MATGIFFLLFIVYILISLYITKGVKDRTDRTMLVIGVSLLLSFLSIFLLKYLQVIP